VSKFKKPHLPSLRPVLQKLGKAALRVVTEGVTEFTHDHRERFVDRILDQDFRSFQVVFYPESGTNLSPRWLARKAAKGADSRTMIATGHYISQIRVFRKKTKGGFQLRVGFHPSARVRDLDGNTGNITLDRVARVLEHGSQKMGIPPRPHWEPHLKLMRREAPAVRVQIARRIAREVRKSLGGK
jgi:hypothetical protein